ncbi:MAG: hypothetical protein M5U08_06165 [Burkholderiales bacterium]|nr:hypothetical protein [Burkholderiales bacterium]
MEPSDEPGAPRPETPGAAGSGAAEAAREAARPAPEPAAASPANPYASAQQLTYARWLDIGTRIGFLALVAAFTLYVTGAIAPHVPLEALPSYWTMPVEQYLATIGGPTGWGWVRLAHRGDYLNFVGVAILSSVSIACYLRLLPVFRSERDRAYLGVALAEIAVLVAAASGIFGAGH